MITWKHYTGYLAAWVGVSGLILNPTHAQDVPVPGPGADPIQLGSDGSSNGPGPVQTCGFAIGRMGDARVRAQWTDLTTGSVAHSTVTHGLPRPDIAALFHLRSADVGWCAPAPLDPGNYQVLIQSDDLMGPSSALSFTVTVGALGNPIKSWVDFPSGITTHGSITLGGLAVDSRLIQPGPDGITLVRIAGRNALRPDLPAIGLGDPPLTHTTDPQLPNYAQWHATLTLTPGLWDLTILTVAADGSRNRQMVRVEVVP